MTKDRPVWAAMSICPRDGEKLDTSLKKDVDYVCYLCRREYAWNWDYGFIIVVKEK